MDEFYIRFGKREGHDEFSLYRLSANLDEAKSLKSEEEKQEEKIPETLLGDKQDITMADLMESFSDAMIGHQTSMPMLFYIMREMGYFVVSTDLYPYAKAHGESLDSEDDDELYKIAPSDFAGLFSTLDKVNHVYYASGHIGRMALSNAVAAYDAHVAGVLRLIFNLNKDLLKTAGVSLTSEEAFEINDRSDVHRIMREKKIENVMHESHFDQVKYIDGIMKNEMRAKYKRFAQLIEVFERRNLFTHADGIVNKLYIEKCAAAGLVVDPSEIGRRLPSDLTYLQEALDILTDAGLCLMMACWHKLEKQKPDNIASESVRIGYNLINHKRYRSAAWFLEAVHERLGKLCDAETRMRVVVNLANARKNLKDDAGSEAILATENWNITNDRYRISVSAIRGDVEDVVRRLPNAKQAELITIEEIIEWPLFNHVRTDERFCECVTNEFGRPPVRRIADTPVPGLPNAAPTGQG